MYCGKLIDDLDCQLKLPVQCYYNYCYKSSNNITSFMSPKNSILNNDPEVQRLEEINLLKQVIISSPEHAQGELLGSMIVLRPSVHI
jgi:hypothetical protein